MPMQVVPPGDDVFVEVGETIDDRHGVSGAVLSAATIAAAAWKGTHTTCPRRHRTN